MLDKILKWFGLVRISKVDTFYRFDENYYGFDNQKFDILKDKLRKNTELKDYLDWTIVQDVKRFFSASPSEHPIIRGAISRTRYIRSLCVNDDEKKLPNQRYM